MDNFKAFQISAAGMTAERARLDAAALNLANANASSAPGTAGYRPVKAVIHTEPTAFSTMVHGQAPALPKAQVVPQSDVAPRLAYEPGHPHADASGMVAYPGIDHTSEMLTVISATRAYEANLAALQATRAMMNRALDIGGGQ
jgi:flagellar basal-body rod protein FlgC